MLTNLHVKNLALIEEENIDFNEGLNILSGETGAGKSIILGSLNAALGGKTSSDFIRSGCEYGLAEALFVIDDDDKLRRINELGVLDVSDGEILISRKIMPSRTQIKVNGQTFTAAQTRVLAAELIDIHGQQDNQILTDEVNHLILLDDYAGNRINELKANVYDNYKEYIKALHILEELTIDEEERQRELSFLEYEVNEIESANLKVGEDEELEAEYKRMNNFQKIVSDLSEVNRIMSEDSNNLSDLVQTALRALIDASGYDEKLNDVKDIMADIESLVFDVNHSISQYMNDFNFDEEKFIEIENRLDLINSLKQKYGSSIQKILDVYEKKRIKLDELNNYSEVLERKKANLNKAKKQYNDYAKQLSEKRQSIALELEKVIIKALKELNFLDVRFKIEFNIKEKPSSTGIDDIRFMISTNPGENIKQLSKIASGGELSRIMLAIKSTIAQEDNTKTLIFDEIDAGISGKTAALVSYKLGELSKNNQIICITHLPQIAAMADYHYLIEKSTKDERTISNIRELSENESVSELARMLGASKITDAALANALEMKKMAKDKKN